MKLPQFWAAFVLSSLLITACRGADNPSPWPQWQGPNRDNSSTETGLLKQWPAGGPTLLWKIRGIGGGFADVSIANDKIYTLGDLADGCYVIALDLSGKKLWQTKLGESGGGNGYPGPRAQPTVTADTLIALGQFGNLLCIDAISGKLRWRKSLKSDLHGAMMSGWGYAESPLIDEGHVICTPGGRDGTMAALDVNSGNLIWRSKGMSDLAAYCSPVVATIGGRKQYVQLTDQNVFGVSTDGQVLWKEPRKGSTAVIPTPIVHDNEVWVTSGYNVGCSLVEISQQNGKFSAKQVYANKNMKNHHGGCILLNGYVYGSNDPGILTCLDFQTGQVKWKDRSIGKGSLACADGHLYLRAENSGAVALIDATPDGYHLISQFDQPDRSEAMAWPHPIIANGRLYLRDQDVLLCYDIRSK